MLKTLSATIQDSGIPTAPGGVPSAPFKTNFWLYAPEFSNGDNMFPPVGLLQP